MTVAHLGIVSRWHIKIRNLDLHFELQFNLLLSISITCPTPLLLPHEISHHCGDSSKSPSVKVLYLQNK